MVEMIELEMIPSEMLVNELGGVRTMELDGSTRRLRVSTTEAVLVNYTLWGKCGHHLTL